MGDNDDDGIGRAGHNPNHITDPAIRGIKNALLQGVAIEVDRDSATVRVINGVGQHDNTSQKGEVLSAQSISPGNAESREIASGGNRLILARTLGDHPLIPSYRKSRSVPNENNKNPLRPIPFPPTEQVGDVGLF